MASVVLYFQVHQPYRLKPYSIFSIGEDNNYFKSNNDTNGKILKKVISKCYLPGNNLLLKLLKKHTNFKISFSISGVLLDQLTDYAPEVINSFKELVETGRVELLSETYYHSLASIYSRSEFIRQIKLHQQLINKLFKVNPTAFRNTELIYNNDLATLVEALGYQVILAEGVDRYLGWRSPNFVYKPKDSKSLKMLLKNYRLSDDIAFRFSKRDWHEWPLTADKFASWLNAYSQDADVINIFLDYETFGEHQWADSGIFSFLEQLPQAVANYKSLEFSTITEAANRYQPKDEVDMPEFTSWADSERDLSAWLSNPMQQEAASAVFELESMVKQRNNETLLRDWALLTSSDHFYYMSTKGSDDGQVHSYFSPFVSPYDAFVNFMHVLHDLRQRVYTSPKDVHD